MSTTCPHFTIFLKYNNNFLSTCWYSAYVNCIGYTSYGILRKDFYLFFANLPGLCLAVFYSLVAISLLAKSETKRDTDKMNLVIGGLLFGIAFWCIFGMAAGMAFENTANPRAHAATMIGLTACVFSIIYYTAPLTTAMTVISTKNAESLYAPMIIVNFINALLWSLYGLVGINQPAVWVPNMIGLFLAVFQLGLVFKYRDTSRSGHVALVDEVAHKELVRQDLAEPTFDSNNTNVTEFTVMYEPTTNPLMPPPVNSPPPPPPVSQPHWLNE
jgi:uncharacterized protein with PQ loop repeat